MKIASLFSGCGGLDLGFTGGFSHLGRKFDKLPYELAFSNDFDNDAVSVYTANSAFFDGHQITAGDVREVQSESIPEFDLLLAGFPCQPFSNAGKRQGVNDESGRGTLFYECERFLVEAKAKTGQYPKAFVFENVRGIMSSKMPDGITTVPEEISRRMSALGYNVSGKLVRASDYGVPQNRYRFIMVGIQQQYGTFNFDLLEEVVEEYSLPTQARNPIELTMGYALSEIDDSKPQANAIWNYSPGGQFMVDRIGSCAGDEKVIQNFRQFKSLDQLPDELKAGRSWKNVPVDDLPERFRKIHDNPAKYHAPNFYRRFALGEISGTITASAQPENCGITHPIENRRLSVREIARIQSFPDDFTFDSKTLPGAYKVIGNAVPPVLAWVLARALLKHFEKAE